MATQRTKTEHAVYNYSKTLPYVVISPYSKEDWLHERKLGIGASKCGVLIGCRQYKNDSPYQLWRNALGLNPPIEETWPMKKGHLLERLVAEDFERTIGFKVCKNIQGTNVETDWIAMDPEKSHLRVSPDRLFWLNDSRSILNRGILEIKSSSKNYTPDDMQDPNKCLMWFCQLQYQMHVMHLSTGYLGFIHDDGVIGGEEWFAEVKYNEEFCNNILVPAIDDFYINHVLPARKYMEEHADNIDYEVLQSFAPPVTDADDVAQRYPEQVPGSTIEAITIENFTEQLEAYKQRREVIKDLEKGQKEFEDYIRTTMLDRESIVSEDGKPLVTFKAASKSSKFDSAAFKKSMPDIYAQFVVETEGSRRLIIK